MDFNNNNSSSSSGGVGSCRGGIASTAAAPLSASSSSASIIADQKLFELVQIYSQQRSTDAASARAASPRFRAKRLELEDSLRCPICLEVFQIPACLRRCEHHVFCSECLQNTLKSQTVNTTRRLAETSIGGGGGGGAGAGRDSAVTLTYCPVCRVPAHRDRDVVPRPDLELVAIRYRHFLDANGIPSAEASEDEGGDGRDGDEGDQGRKPPPPSAASRSRSSCSTAEDANSSNDAPSRRKRNRRQRQQYKDDDDDDDEEELGVSEAHQQKAASAPAVLLPTLAPPVKQQQLQKLSRRTYNGMKKAQLKKLCGDAGLLVHGSEKELKERHSNFTTLWNVNCDSIMPKSRQAIAQEVNQREMAKKRESMSSITAKVHAKCVDRMFKNANSDAAASREAQAAAGPALPGSRATDDGSNTLQRWKVGSTTTATATAGLPAPLPLPPPPRSSKTMMMSGDPDFDKEFNDNFRQMIASLREKREEERRQKLGLSPGQEQHRQEADQTQQESPNDNTADSKPATSAAAAAGAGAAASAASTSSSSTGAENVANGSGEKSCRKDDIDDLGDRKLPAIARQRNEDGSGNSDGNKSHVGDNAAAFNPGAARTLPPAAASSSSSSSSSLLPQLAGRAHPSTLLPGSENATTAAKTDRADPRQLQREQHTFNDNRSSNTKRKHSGSFTSNEFSSSGAAAAPAAAPAASGQSTTRRRRTSTATSTFTTSRNHRQQRRRDSIFGPWTCPACTFINNKKTWSTAECEMCSTKRNSSGNSTSAISSNDVVVIDLE